MKAEKKNKTRKKKGAKSTKKEIVISFLLIKQIVIIIIIIRNLGIDDFYFALESVETIANHIMALYGAKILAYTKHENVLAINLEKESDDSSVYIHSSEPGISQLQGPQCEKRYGSCLLFDGVDGTKKLL